MAFISPLSLEREILGMHKKEHGEVHHAHVMYPDGHIVMTKGKDLLFERSEFTVCPSIAGLKLNFQYVLLPPTMTKDDLWALHRRLSEAVCLEILHRCRAFPEDSGANLCHNGLMCLALNDNTEMDNIREETQNNIHDKWKVVLQRKEPLILSAANP